MIGRILAQRLEHLLRHDDKDRDSLTDLSDLECRRESYTRRTSCTPSASPASLPRGPQSDRATIAGPQVDLPSGSGSPSVQGPPRSGSTACPCSERCSARRLDLAPSSSWSPRGPGGPPC